MIDTILASTCVCVREREGVRDSVCVRERKIAATFVPISVSTCVCERERVCGRACVYAGIYSGVYVCLSYFLMCTGSVNFMHMFLHT